MSVLNIYMGSNNVNKCNLTEEINKCPFYTKEDKSCGNERECVFRYSDKPKEKNDYVRQERWYEKYYKK